MPFMPSIGYFLSNFGWGEIWATVAIALVIVFIRERHHFFKKKAEQPPPSME